MHIWCYPGHGDMETNSLLVNSSMKQTSGSDHFSRLHPVVSMLQILGSRLKTHTLHML